MADEHVSWPIPSVEEWTKKVKIFSDPQATHG